MRGGTLCARIHLVLIVHSPRRVSWRLIAMASKSLPDGVLRPAQGAAARPAEYV